MRLSAFWLPILICVLAGLSVGRADRVRQSCELVSRLETLVQQTRAASAGSGKSIQKHRAELLDGPIQKLPNTIYVGLRTVSDAANKGIRPDQLPAGVIPRDFLHFYDPQTGHFNYHPAKPQVLAAENGSQKLQAVRLNYDGGTHGFNGASSPLIIRDYERVMREIPNLELWVTHHETEAAELSRIIEKFPKDLRNRIRTIPHKIEEPEIWAQDGSKPIANGAETLIHNGPADETNPRVHYRWITEKMAKTGMIEIRKSPFNFAGGNVVVGDRHVFVGTKSISDTMRRFNIDRENAIEALSAEFGKPVFEVGVPSRGTIGGAQPIAFHIDLDMAVLRNRRAATPSEIIMVQSPEKLLTDVFGFPKLDDLNPAQFEKEKRKVLARLRLEAANGRILPLTERGLVNGLANLKYADVMAQDTQLQYLERVLKEDGYKTARVPGIRMTANRIENPNFNTDSLQYYNYTNLIASGDKVLVPNYGIKAMDDAAKRVFREAGYDVIPMKSAPNTMCLNGGPRCVSETYRRPVYETKTDR